jgi:hypothetical protein
MPKLIAYLVIGLLADPSVAMAGCLPEQPSVVRVTGVLERIVFAGPPNYESVRAGDAAEPYFVLRLARPVCVLDPVEGRVSSRRLQLFLEPAQYAPLRPKLGHAVKLSGQLWPAETGHHHTPLMFTPANRQDGR